MFCCRPPRRPTLGPSQRRRLPSRQPFSRRTRRASRTAWRCDRRRGAHPRRYRAWEAGIDAVLASGVPAVVLGGEATPDADLMGLSTVAGGIVAEAHAYLANGGRQPAAVVAVPLRRNRPHRRGIRAARADSDVGSARARVVGSRRRTDRRDPLLPRPPPGRKYRIRSRALRRGRKRRRPALPVFCSSLRTAEPALSSPGNGRRHRGDRPGRRRLLPAGSGPAARTRNGISAPWPSSTSRSCRGCA